MSQIDIKSFFKLGLDSTDDAGEEAGLINTIRTPVDTQSRQLNRVTFKVPKIGMLTADSHINLRFTTTKNNVGLKWEVPAVSITYHSSTFKEPLASNTNGVAMVVVGLVLIVVVGGALVVLLVATKNIDKKKSKKE